MKYGFIKVGSAIPDLHVADCAYNAEKITELAMRADENGVVKDTPKRNIKDLFGDDDRAKILDDDDDRPF